MTAFITSLLFVVLAEMGDKTQLLAMCFAMKYRWQTVMWGVFVATLLNHLIAVLIGTFMTTLVPMLWIQIAASISFIIFGLWTIRGDRLNCVNETVNRSPFWVVAIAFFIAECGDKTQLATLALAAQYKSSDRCQLAGEVEKRQVSISAITHQFFHHSSISLPLLSSNRHMVYGR